MELGRPVEVGGSNKELDPSQILGDLVETAEAKCDAELLFRTSGRWGNL